MPEDWQKLDEYKLLLSWSTYLSEQAKIELSSDERVKVGGETNVEDLDGEEIYLDVPIDRESFYSAIKDFITKAIETARSTIKKSGLTAEDIDKIIFIGGPNNYKQIRARVVNELGIPLLRGQFWLWYLHAFLLFFTSFKHS